jgi:CRISPR-associated protein Csx10
VRDALLAPSDDPDDFRKALENALARAGADGVRLEAVTRDEGHVPISYDVSRTDSWHTRWNLPRPVLLGFAAGGCFTFTVSAALGADVLSAVELAGVGERRGEGFGQVRLNAPLLAGEAPGPPPDPGPDPDQDPVAGPLLEPSDPGHAEARIIERAAWRTEIWRRAEHHAADPGNAVLRGLTGLSATRLNTLRRLFAHLDEDSADLRRRVDALTANWRDPGTTEAIKTLLTRTDVFALLGLASDGLCLTADGDTALRTELRADALRSLITACLAVHTRREAHAHSGEEAHA